MNESQSNLPAADEQTELIASLRRQMTILLLALIILSGTLTAYLFYQSRTMSRDLNLLEPRAKVVIDNYQQNLPRIQKFVQELQAYGQKHSDFQPLLKRYGIPLTPQGVTNSTAKPKP